MMPSSIADISRKGSAGARHRIAWIVVALAAAAGLALRLRGATGDLWLDEAWSYALLAPLTSPDQIFWKINHDNNHFLNSVWLYLVGPDAPPVLARALSISLGAASVFAAALAARGEGATTPVNALLFATSLIMVSYGSEARGYAGLVLFTLAAVILLEDRLDGIGRPVAFGAAVLLGFLSHLTMAATVAMLVLWAAAAIWQRTRSLRAINVEIGNMFAPAFLAVIPLGLCMLAGRMLDGFSVGGVLPFSPAGFAEGFGGAIRFTLGLPAGMNDWAVIAVTLAAVTISCRLWPGRRSGLYVTGIIVLPLAMALVHMPNVQFPRYFLVSMTLLLLWLGDNLGRAINAGGAARSIAIAACALFVAGNAVSTIAFFDVGRGTYQPIVDRIALDADNTYGASHDMRVPIVVDLLARLHAATPDFIPAAELCARPPRWFVLEGIANPSPMLAPDPECGLVYERIEAYAAGQLAGSDWALYRRADP